MHLRQTLLHRAQPMLQIYLVQSQKAALSTVPVAPLIFLHNQDEHSALYLQPFHLKAAHTSLKVLVVNALSRDRAEKHNR